jgi:type IV pilus assembly protein PilX
MVALIVLVAMTLAGIALMRSVDTTTIIAGNLGFQQSAMHSGDSGTEAAVSWLIANNTGGTTLYTNDPNKRYYVATGLAASGGNPAANESWDHYWTKTLDPSAASTPVSSAVASGNVWTLPTDPVTGNTVSYYIQRLCIQSVAPENVNSGCAVSQAASVTTGSSKGAGVVALLYASQYYYRITTRITGPRNTVSYIQTIIAL